MEGVRRTRSYWNRVESKVLPGLHAEEEEGGGGGGVGKGGGGGGGWLEV